MRKTARVDANQAAIVEALRAIGASVQSLAMVGRGVPDLLVGFRSQNWLIEVKDGAKPQSARRLTADEVAWHDGWRGQVATVASIEDALELVSSSIINR
jgi:hypothetical protein